MRTAAEVDLLARIEALFTAISEELARFRTPTRMARATGSPDGWAGNSGSG